VNAWGYKMTVTPLGGAASSSGFLEDAPALCLSPDNSALEYFYLTELGRDGFSRVTPVDDLNLEAFASKKACKYCANYIDLDSDNLRGGAEESKESEPVSLEDVTVQTPKSGVFKVRTGTPGRTSWPQGYSVSEVYDEPVHVYSQPSPDSDVVLSVAARDYYFLASEADGDWLRINVFRSDLTEAFKVEEGSENQESEDVASPPSVTSERNLIGGWVRLKHEDNICLVRNDIVPGSVPELIVIPSHLTISIAEAESTAAAAAENVNLAVKHPMYGIDESNSTLENPNAKGLDTMDLVRSSRARVASKMLNASEECCIGYSHSVLAQWLSHWPAEFPFSVDSFGGLSSLLSYILITYTSEEKLYADALNHLKQLIIKSVKSVENVSAHVLCENLVSYAKRQLSSSNQMSTVVAPVSRGMHRVIETRHPYENNMDQSYSVKLPGAKYLLLVFDERSATETNSDYLLVTDSKGNEVGGRMTGTAGSTDKNWPGVGGKAPLRIDGDECYMTFHSDGGVVDWGFKLSIYGVVEEPTEYERKEYTNYMEKMTKRAVRPEFACWLLLLLSREHSELLDTLLFTADTLKSVSEYFISAADNEKKVVSLQLLSNIVQGIQRFSVIPSEVITETLKIRESVVAASNNLYKADTNNGSDTSKVSKLLQLCVQLIVVIDALIGSATGSSGGTTARPSSASAGSMSNKSSSSTTTMVRVPSRTITKSLPEGVVALEGDDNLFLHAVDQRGLHRWLPEGLPDNLELASARRVLRRKPVSGNEGADLYSTAMSKYGFQSGIHSFNIRVLEYTNGGPIIGVAMLPIAPTVQLGASAEQFDIGWGNQFLYVQGNEPVPFGPIIRPGDIISVTIDVGKGSVSFFRNSALVGVAVGAANSGAVVETAIGVGPFYPAVSLRNFGDSVEFANVPLTTSKLSEPTNSVDKGSLVPDWMKPLKEAVFTMRSFLSREVPPSILSSRFVPVCMRKASSVVRLSSTSPSVEIDIPEASALCFFYGTSTLGSGDMLRVLDTSGTVLFEKNAIENVSLPGDIVSAAMILFGNSTSSSTSGSEAKITVGSSVVRGPSWCYGDQDGGIGSVGTVTSVQEWKGVPESGIQVSWLNTGLTGLYRLNYFGENDIQLFISTEPVQAKGAAVSTSNAVVIVGNKVVFELSIAEPPNADTAPTISLHIVPKLSVSTAMGTPAFDPLLSYLRAQYAAGGSIQGDLAMVRHIDNRAKPSNMSAAALLSAKWDIFKPSENELTKSCTLKAIAELPVVEYPEGFEKLTVSDAAADMEVNIASDIFIVPLATALSHSECATLAMQLGGSLPSLNDLQETDNALNRRLGNNRVFWPVSDGPDEWVRMADTDESCSICESTEPLPEVDGSDPLSIGLKLPVCGGGRKCESCDCDTVPSFHQYAFGQFECNTCRRCCPCENGRWLCISCQSDYCFCCNPPALSAATQQKVNLISNQLLNIEELIALHGCTASGVRADCTAEFDSLEDAIVCNTFLEQPLSAVVFDPQTGKFFLREGDLEPSVNGCVVLKAKSKVAPQDPAAVGGSSGVAAELPVQSRYGLIRTLNAEIGKALPFVDLTLVDQPGSVASLLSLCRGLIFDSVKTPLWEEALSATTGSGGQFELRLSRSRARKFAGSGPQQVDHDGRFMVFSQAFRQMHPSKRLENYIHAV
jgi:hypothetical protein